MESSSTLDMDVLINVLNQGNDHIRELRAQIDNPGSAEACKSLARQAQSAFAAAIAMAKLSKHTPSKPDFSDSPLSTSDSTRSDGSDQKAFKEHECKTKRKAMPRWSRHVRVCSASGSSMEGNVDDGYSWRKYGQKDILGSKFPRGYYRCTHRHTHGCFATKQVQRSDVDLAVFQVSYRGSHTCSRDRLISFPSAASPHEDHSLQQTNATPTKTNCLISDDQQPSSSLSFSFPSMRTESGMKPDNAHFMESFNSPAFMMTAAAAAEMSFSLPLSGPSSVGAGTDICRSGNLEMAEMLSASDFGLEHIVFDTDFPFEF